MSLKNEHARCPSYRVGVLVTAAFLLSVTFSLTASAMNVLASSDFDNGPNDFDGWTAHECGNFGLCPIDVAGVGGDLGPEPVGGATFFHEIDQGNPNGNLHGTDPTSGSTVLFNAPGKFLSNLTLGTTLMFDMFIDGTTYDDGGLGSIPLFYVSNGASTIFYAVPLAEAPVGQWLSFAIDILPNAGAPGPEGAWFSIGADIEVDDNTKFGDIFDNSGLATELRFWGELTKDKPDGVDGVLLDNVIISAPVPVPAALPLMFSALAGFGFAARRKK